MILPCFTPRPTPAVALCCLLGSLLCFATQAAEPATRRLSLSDAIQAALLNNRALQIERINPEVSRLALSEAWGIYDPLLTAQGRRENITDSGAFDPANPGVDRGFDSESDIAGVGLTGLLPSGLTYSLNGSYGHSTGSRDFLNFDSYRANAGIFLQQPLLKNSWIDLPRLTIRVNRNNLKISEEGVRFTAMTVLNLVQQGYSDLVTAWEQLAVQQELLDTRERFLRGVRRQVELGAMTVLEEKVAVSQRSQVETDVVAASNTVALAGNNLRTLMGTKTDEWDEVPLTPAERLLMLEQPLDMKASWQRGVQRPDLVQLIKVQENANSNLKFRRNQLFPGLDLVGGYGRKGASSVQAFPPDDPQASSGEAFDQLARGDAPNDMVGLLFTMPLSRARERANFKTGKELVKQTQLVVKQKEELILREISDAIHNARFSFERYQSARRAVESAQAALKAEEEKLAGGKSSIIFVLQFQADVASAKTAEVVARGDYNKAISQVHYAEGTLLDRHRVEFQFK